MSDHDKAANVVTAPPSNPAGSPEKPVRRVAVFGVVALSLMMMAIDSTIVATALHDLQNGLGATVNWAGWTLTAYSLGFVLMLPVTGKLAERYGQRRIFLISLLIFTLASLLCGLAENIFMLIALRALQAAGGAGFTPTATGIIVNHFGDARDRAVSLFGSIFPVGAMIGPIVGAFIVTYWSWRGVFFVNVPVGILALILAWRLIPHDLPRKPGPRFSMDLPGMALLGVGLVAGMLAASYLAETGAEAWSAAFAIPVVVATASMSLFFRHIRRTDQPFILPRLITGKDFGAVNLINAAFGGFTIGTMSLVPLYAVTRYRFSVFDSGMLLIAQGLAAIVFSIGATMVLRRTGYRRPIYIGGCLIAAGMLCLALSPRFGLSDYTWLASGAFLVGAGSGIVNPASRNAGLQLAPQHSSTLAALRSVFMQVGAIVAISATTAILTAAETPGTAQAAILAIIAALMVSALPIIRGVPEHHGSW